MMMEDIAESSKSHSIRASELPIIRSTFPVHTMKLRMGDSMPEYSDLKRVVDELFELSSLTSLEVSSRYVAVTVGVNVESAIV